MEGERKYGNGNTRKGGTVLLHVLAIELNNKDAVVDGHNQILVISGEHHAGCVCWLYNVQLQASNVNSFY